MIFTPCQPCANPLVCSDLGDCYIKQRPSSARGRAQPNSDTMKDSSALTLGSSAWLASFVGAKCRCGCGKVSTHVMTGTEFGKPISPEPCCYTAGSYCGALADEAGDEHALYELGEANAQAQATPTRPAANTQNHK